MGVIAIQCQHAFQFSEAGKEQNTAETYYWNTFEGGNKPFHTTIKIIGEKIPKLIAYSYDNEKKIGIFCPM